MIPRRLFLAAWSCLAAPALGEGIALSPRPRARPVAGQGARTAETAEAAAERLWQQARLSGALSYLALDMASGATIAQRAADLPLPPASVGKIVTSLYALDRLGADFRFATRIMAQGTLREGVLEGDLYLVGGGDPNLDTDQLGDLVARLAATGLRRVTGRFIACDGALSRVSAITDEQPAHLGYNPAISGLNLNYNRVNFEWQARQGGWRIGLNARGERFVPEVRGITGGLAGAGAPLFTHRLTPEGEDWQVARDQLSGDGSRWLPVRRPAPYVAEVFATLAAAHGLALGPARIEAAPPQAAVELLRHEGEPLADVLRKMLKYSTNLTAEVVGLRASGAADPAQSAAQMGQWAAQVLGLSASRFVDHSGLGAQSLTTARDLVLALRHAGRARHGALLAGLLRETGLAEGAAEETQKGGARVLAKSGTMNFVSNLAGRVRLGPGREIVFALLVADPPRREAVPLTDREEPKGAAAWTKRARRLHKELLRLWARAPG